jgi:hypothetical protein
MIGDQVSEYVCDSMDEMMDIFEGAKEMIENAREDS